MIIHNVEQGSLDWFKLKLGKVTGTRLKELMGTSNLGLIDKLIGELVSEQVKEGKASEEMQRGTDMEPIARQAYEDYTGLKVEEVGFLQSEKYEWFGVSPDGLIRRGEIYYKGTEFKCPDTHTHVKWIRQGGLPSEHKYQIYSYFIVNPNHEEHDFVSYDNRFTVRPIFIHTVYRNEIKAELEEVELAMEKFYEKFQKYYDQITF